MKDRDINQIEIEETSSKNIYFSIIESLLFVSGEPIHINHIASIIECSVSFAKDLLDEMINSYNSEGRGIKLINTNDSYSLVTNPENSSYIEKLLGTNSRQSLSQAALETLAIIAYKQPITRVEIDEIRGVKSERAIATLVEKGLVKESGRLEVPGRPILYGTTDEFLKYFGLQSIGQMPGIEELIGEFNLDEEEEFSD
ncbi:SMC-Scp complex subunit ScpB [Clostridium sp. CX1]|uniref:SMC-Scp complex subunit ScpB n=1 Tax=Clostridium sp. CX1 TaxID=2978346 RepID=UPI0021BF3672|nr:SMC-Scp complex subunit ScpB [Clostridium sp. CX1]MCT8976011.1 SMC-Scp complex subunit ScpB [Clostridium sp. CX1]